MPDLVPRFILEQYAADNHHGQLSAVTLFMDISGFAAMTQTLMQQGKEGAEWIAAALNHVFDPIIQTVHHQGGFITGFAGDAFTALFPGTDNQTALRACQTALTILQVMADLGQQTTPSGTFTLAVKQGLSAGLVEWGIIGPPNHKTYFFRGPAIQGCALAEQTASSSDIVLDGSVQSLLAPDDVLAQPQPGGFAHLLAIAVKVPRPKRKSGITFPIRVALAEHFFPLSLGAMGQHGEFRNVATVFLSFAGDPPLAQLDDFISRVMGMMRQFGGHFAEVDFGDKGGLALVYFGAPTTHENDIARALDFVLALQIELAEVGLLWRAGISFGPVYTGLIGTVVRGKYSTLGNQVNLASRLMSRAGWGQILVTETIARHPGYEFHHLGNFAYKGFPRPVPTYQLWRRREVEDVPFAQNMVGREAELQQMYQFVQTQLAQEKAGVILLYGEPGMGKSRLSYALRQALGDSVSWFVGQTDQVLLQAFGPFIYWLRRYFAQSPDLPDGENKSRFSERLETLAAATSPVVSQELHRTHSFVGALLGLTWPGSLYEQVDARLRYVNTLAAIKHIFLAESKLRPVVLELEDGQWLDEASHELLTLLTQERNGYPFWIVLTSRYQDDGTKPTFRLAHIATLTLELKSLPLTAVEQQAGDILGGQVEAVLVQLLQEKTQANPFFVQQILYFLRENDQLVRREDNIWTIQDTNFDLPVSINAILIARLDRLALAVKQVVQAAAVLGREFELHVLSQMLEADVSDMVQEAEQEQIWSALREMHYIFKHVLLRDAAYEMQLRAQRRRLHALAAATYEQLYTGQNHDQGDLYASRIASHYERAEVGGKMAYWYGRAGHQAQANYALENAAAYYQRALATGALNPAEQLPLYDGLGETQRQQARYSEAHATYRQMLALAEATANKMGQVRAWIGLAWVWQCQGAYQESLASAQQAETLLRAMSPPEPAHLAEVLYHKGWAHFFLGQSAEALAVAGEELAFSQEAEDAKGIVQSLNLLSVVQYYSLGQYAAAEQNQQVALTLARQSGDRHSEGFLLNNLGENWLQQGDAVQAALYYEQAWSIARETGDQDVERAYRSNLAAAQVFLGQFDAAAATLHDVIGQAPADWYILPDSYCHLAEAYLGLKQTHEALAAAHKAFALVYNNDNLGRAWRVLGDAAAQAGRAIPVNEANPACTAADCYEQSVALLAAAGMEREQAITLWHWAQYEMAQGKEQGEQLRHTAQAIFQKLNLPLWVVKTGREVG